MIYENECTHENEKRTDSEPYSPLERSGEEGF